MGRAPAGRAPGGVFYCARTDVPDHWYPFAPQRVSADGSVVLRMLSLLAPRALVPRPPPQGALLASAGTDEAWIHEAEVPRSGAEVVRTRQHARWHDGSVHAWTGRQKRAGRGEGSSGLRFDFVDETR